MVKIYLEIASSNKSDGIPEWLAWHYWLVESCRERHNGHLWLLECEPGERAGVYCWYCATSIDDEYNIDTYGLLFGKFDEIEIDEDKHNAKEYIEIPVKVKIHCDSLYSHYYGCTEYEIWVELTNN